MKKTKTIVYGPGLFDVKTGKDIDFHVNSVYFLNNDLIHIVLEEHKTKKMEHIEISVQQAENIGFINFNALSNYCK